MEALGWRCYRCGLEFRDEAVARTHERITGHSTTRARVISAQPAGGA